MDRAARLILAFGKRKTDKRENITRPRPAVRPDSPVEDGDSADEEDLAGRPRAETTYRQALLNK